MKVPPRRSIASIGVAQNSKANASTLPVSGSNGGNAGALETSIRQLLVNGNSKAALENAKQLHKSEHTSASESLLLEAYRARIQALLDQNLALEAKSLIRLVAERFPNAQALLNDVGQVASARSGDLAALLKPLNDPELSAERRADLERIIQTQVSDLRALAECTALPPEHSLRQAAAALDRAFDAATSGPVNEEQIALPEVSHRSPLAPWKLLIRAIACLHRGEDQQCREYLVSIKPESVPSRLVPSMQAILGVDTKAGALKPPERALVSRISGNLSDLRSALEQVDRAFSGHDDNQIFKAVHAAVRECQRSAPDRLGTLKQIIHVRGGSTGLDARRLATSLDGEPRRDAAYFRMFSRALEIFGADDPYELAEACELWDEFRQHALREGIFTAQSVEMAQLYLHMAGTLRQIPVKILKEMQQAGGYGGKQPQGDERQYYLYPDKLFARACVMDPHPEAFSQWLSWANDQSVTLGESVAKEWHRIRPGDIEPLLHLMKQSEKRNAFPSALGYLEKAERIDAIDSTVRAARLRLLAAAAIRHLQQKKPRLAMEKITEMAELPQSQQADRPGFLAALRTLTCAAAKDQEGTDRSIHEAEALLGELPAALLRFGIAAAAKRLDLASMTDAKALKPVRRETIPASLARTMAIAKDFGIRKFSLPVSYFDEAEKQFPQVADTLALEQISALGEMGIATDHPKLAWASATAGLKRAGPTEAFFLLLRARALPRHFEDRRRALASAAAALARFHRDTQVVDQAVELLRDPFGGDSFSLPLEQAREIARKEAASPDFPGLFDAGPDYSDLFADTLCQCSNCRRERGETPGMFDDEDRSDEGIFEEGLQMDETEMRRIFNQSVPKEVPPDMAEMLFKVMKEAFQSGEAPEELLSQILGGRGGRKQKKGRRNR
jgi:tetratricopeptide (TPR) repeat protein